MAKKDVYNDIFGDEQEGFEDLFGGEKIKRNKPKTLKERINDTIKTADVSNDQRRRLSIKEPWLRRLHEWATTNKISKNAVPIDEVVCFMDKLDLASASISDLPKDIGMLKSLKEIDLKNNYFTDLPKDLNKATKTVKLNLELNRCQHIPAVVFELKNLLFLNMYENELREISSDIAKLSNLEHLFLGNNKIQFLPQSLTSLKNLQIIDLRGNHAINKRDPILITLQNNGCKVYV